MLCLRADPEQLKLCRIHLQAICCHQVDSINDAVSEMRDNGRHVDDVVTVTVHVYM